MLGDEVLELLGELGLKGREVLGRGGGGGGVGMGAHNVRSCPFLLLKIGRLSLSNNSILIKFIIILKHLLTRNATGDCCFRCESTSRKGGLVGWIQMGKIGAFIKVLGCVLVKFYLYHNYDTS